MKKNWNLLVSEACEAMVEHLEGRTFSDEWTLIDEIYVAARSLQQDNLFASAIDPRYDSDSVTLTVTAVAVSDDTFDAVSNWGNILVRYRKREDGWYPVVLTSLMTPDEPLADLDVSHILYR